MTKVGFVTSPLYSGHAIRGVGFYTQRLLPLLKIQGAKRSLEIKEVKDPSLLNKFTFDLVHYPYFDLFTHSLPLLRHYKTVVTIHDVIPLEFADHYPAGLKGGMNLWMQKLALSSVAGVVTDSYASVKAIHKYLRVPHRKIKLVYLAAGKNFRPIADKGFLARIKKKYRLPSEFVLYVGDVNWNKNIENLIRACEMVGYPLVIVGKQAAELSTLSAHIPSGPRDLLRRTLGQTHPELTHLNNLLQLFSKKNVLRLGFVPEDDLVAIYNLAKVYCQPSFAEGFGLPVLEAMACGTAVACSRTHSLPEVGGSAATYFDPYNIHQMSQAIVRAKPGRGIDQAGMFSWEKAAAETIMVYTSLI